MISTNGCGTMLGLLLGLLFLPNLQSSFLVVGHFSASEAVDEQSAIHSYGIAVAVISTFLLGCDLRFHRSDSSSSSVVVTSSFGK